MDASAISNFYPQKMKTLTKVLLTLILLNDNLLCKVDAKGTAVMGAAGGGSDSGKWTLTL